MAALPQYFMDIYFYISYILCWINLSGIAPSPIVMGVGVGSSITVTIPPDLTTLFSMSDNELGGGGDDKGDKRVREEGNFHSTLINTIPPLPNTLLYFVKPLGLTSRILKPHSVPSLCFPLEVGALETGEEEGERKRRNTETETMEVDESEEKVLLGEGNSTTLNDMNICTATRDINFHVKTKSSIARNFRLPRALIDYIDTSASQTKLIFVLINRPTTSDVERDESEEKGKAKRKLKWHELSEEGQARRRASLKAKRERKREKVRALKREAKTGLSDCAPPVETDISPAKTNPSQSSNADLRSKLPEGGKTMDNGGSDPTPKPKQTSNSGGSKGKGKEEKRQAKLMPAATLYSTKAGATPASAMPAAAPKVKKQVAGRATKPNPPPAPWQTGTLKRHYSA